MTSHFSIKNNIVHLWHAVLTDFVNQEQDLHKLLHADELHRAERFRFPLHRQRFIITRALLRKTLSLYTNIPPKDLEFSYGEHGKPFLKNNTSEMQFNTSHSHNMAVFALTIQKEIGVDIEQVESQFKEGVAKRFFTDLELEELLALPEEDRAEGFYRIWSRKESLIKALGEGLYGPIKDFSIPLKNGPLPILLHYKDKAYHFEIASFDVDPHYQAAFATTQPVEQIFRWQWTEAGAMEIKR